MVWGAANKLQSAPPVGANVAKPKGFEVRNFDLSSFNVKSVGLRSCCYSEV